MKSSIPTQLVIHFTDKCKQVLTPSEHFFKDAKGYNRIPSARDWEEIAKHIINGKDYQRYETI